MAGYKNEGTQEKGKEKTTLHVSNQCEIERQAMIRNRPPIRDIKGKETQTRNNWILMETSQAKSQTDRYFPTKWPNGYPKQKDVSDTHIQRRTITK